VRGTKKPPRPYRPRRLVLCRQSARRYSVSLLFSPALTSSCSPDAPHPFANPDDPRSFLCTHVRFGDCPMLAQTA
jgi:hypothetical protein